MGVFLGLSTRILGIQTIAYALRFAKFGDNIDLAAAFAQLSYTFP